jgi:tetratricopeptide (TPR) repeat protein
LAYKYYNAVYCKYPTSYLADDALGMLGLIHCQNKEYKEALNVYVKLLKQYPHSDQTDFIWASIRECLMEFKLSPDGVNYTFGNQVINSKEFLQISINATNKTGYYDLLERFNFWQNYLNIYNSDHKSRVEYIKSLLQAEIFIEAESQLSKIPKEYHQALKYLEIKKIL